MVYDGEHEVCISSMEMRVCWCVSKRYVMEKFIYSRIFRNSIEIYHPFISFHLEDYVLMFHENPEFSIN